MDLSLFYGADYDKKLDERASALYDLFAASEKRNPEFVFSSPGRAEILGNHTDHNHGKVMVAAINCDILCFASKNLSGEVKICSEGYAPIVTDVKDLKADKKEYGSSLGLVKGVMAKLNQSGYKFGGFTAYITSNIFKGAGVSSSAAFEVLICEIINRMYLDGALDEITKAVVSQYSENVYFGKPCGLLDQCGIALGSLSKLDFFVPEQPIVRRLKAPSGYTLVITNTGGDHAKLTPHYAAIRTEMESVASCFNKKVLRDVDYRDFVNSFSTLKNKVSERAIMRAVHFYKENERVDKAEKALDDNDVTAFLDCIAQSGESSLAVLQNCYVPGDIRQPVALAVEYGKLITKNSVFRVHGGGFAGSVLGFIENSELHEYVSRMSEVFGAENVFTATIRAIGTHGFKI